MAAPDPTSKPKTPYSIEEVLLVAEVGYSEDWPGSSAVEEKLREISELLRISPNEEFLKENSKFRNIDGIRRKYEDLRTRRPGYSGKPTRGGRNDLLVIGLFESFPAEAFEMARKARETLRK